MIINITDTTHLEHQMHEYKTVDQLVVIEFHATWCGPCRTFAPKLTEISEEKPDLPIFIVDVDECDEIAAEYKIMATPYFLFYKKGELVEKFAGANIDKFKAVIEEHATTAVAAEAVDAFTENVPTK